MGDYHDYVFDVQNRKFVGKFEEMYAEEDNGNFDSWHQSDLTFLKNSISLSIINQYYQRFIHPNHSVVKCRVRQGDKITK